MILAFDVQISRSTTRRRPHRLYASRSTSVKRIRALLLVLVLLVIVGFIHRTEAQSVGDTGGYEDEYAEFVQEVVEEDQDQQHHDGDDGNDYASTLTDQEYERQQEELLRRERDEQERIRQQEEELNRRIQDEREMAFEAELAQLTDEKQKAAARKQKKRDAAIVQRILRRAAKGNFYAVLGLQYRNLFSFHLHIPGCSLPLGPYRMETPEIDMLHFAVTPVHIKRAYRECARAVHPDKCRDGRAVEAFHAVEQAASILLNASTRAAYDAQLAERRRAQRARVRQYLRVGWEQLGRIVRRVQSVFQLLGPFALPLTILTIWIF